MSACLRPKQYQHAQFRQGGSGLLNNRLLQFRAHWRPLGDLEPPTEQSSCRPSDPQAQGVTGLADKPFRTRKTTNPRPANPAPDSPRRWALQSETRVLTRGSPRRRDPCDPPHQPANGTFSANSGILNLRQPNERPPSCEFRTQPQLTRPSKPKASPASMITERLSLAQHTQEP